jgi:hypothetical protein
MRQVWCLADHGVGRITKGKAVTYTLSGGKKVEKVTDVVTGMGSVVKAVSFHRKRSRTSGH